MFFSFLVPFVYTAFFFFAISNKIFFVEFAAGIFIGSLLFLVDRLLHVFFLEPHTEFSLLVKNEWQKKHFLNVVQLLRSAETLQHQLITRSITFLVVYVAMALFMLTSTGSYVGMGVILGMGLHMCADFLRYRKDVKSFQHHFLWQLTRPFSQQEINVFVAGFCLFFVVISMMMTR